MELQLWYLVTVGFSFGLLYTFVLHPILISPLSKVPSAHWSCGISPIWLSWLKWTHSENTMVYRKHMELGDVIRLAPNMVSVNCFQDGLKTIYSGDFPRTSFYFHGFAIYGTDNIFTFEDNEKHAARKRQISATFKKSFVMSSIGARAAARDVLVSYYLPKLDDAARDGSWIEVMEMHYAYFMDVFTQWQFGKLLKSNLLGDEKEKRMYLDAWFGLTASLFWQCEFPRLAGWLRNIGIYLIPKWVDAGFQAIENWNLEKCDRAYQLVVGNKRISEEEERPVLFEHAIKSVSKIDKERTTDYQQRMEIASDMFTHNSAAFETSGNTLTYLLYEMCKHPKWQTLLREEVSALQPPLKYHMNDVGDFPDPKDVDALPVLHAVLMETMRLYPSVPGGQPRIVPRDCTLGGYTIPSGTIAQSYAYALHKNAEVFPDPHVWKPERWLNASEEELVDMKRWFWGFSSGNKMCIGIHFAMYSMKYLVSAIYTNFTTTIHDHGDMELVDAFLAGPKGARLELKFQRVKRDYLSIPKLSLDMASTTFGQSFEGYT